MKTTTNTIEMQKRSYQSPDMTVVTMAGVPVLNGVSGNGMTYGGYDDDGEGD